MSVPHSIRALSARTGLSPHTIRAWERRYGALSPGRTETNRRVYREEDVLRLSLLRSAVEHGHSIGQIAQLPTERLQELLSSSAIGASPLELGVRGEDFLGKCESALERLDPDALSIVLTRAGATLGVHGLLESVVLPFIQVIDQRWEARTITIAQEHMASAELRSYLDRVRSSLAVPDYAPSVVVTTPSGQLHELGALIAAILAALEGWHVVYLGANLPAEDIGVAAKRSKAAAVALSLVYPLRDPLMKAEFETLRAIVGPDVAILIGGRAAESYSEAIEAIGAQQIGGLPDFREALGRTARRVPA